MIYIRSGAHVLELLQLLSVAGEFPMSGLSILGNPRTMRELIHRLEDRQEMLGICMIFAELERETILRPIAVYKRKTRPYA